jgi:dipeptidyl aminopeptidase/acylaminoacyl peptidase
MKRSTFLLLLAAAPVAFTIAACQHDPGTSVQPDAEPLLSHTSPPPAHPVLIAAQPISSHTRLYANVFVMNANATGKTAIINYVDDGSNGITKATFAPDGQHFVYRQMKVISGVAHYRLVTGTLSVANNTPAASNLDTVYETMSSANVDVGAYHDWSAGTSGNQLIAFNGFASGSANTINTIPSTGGTPSTLYTFASGASCAGLSWSPDGQYLAFINVGAAQSNGSHEYTIRVIDRSGTLRRVIFSNDTNGRFDLHWSRSGSNKLSYQQSVWNGTTNVPYLYTLDLHDPSTWPSDIYTAPASSDIAQLVSNAGSGGRWSPDNSKLLYRLPPNSDLYTYSFSTATSTFLASEILPQDWSRVDPW